MTIKEGDKVRFIKDVTYHMIDGTDDIIPLGTLGTVIEDDGDRYHPFTVEIPDIEGILYIVGYDEVERLEDNAE